MPWKTLPNVSLSPGGKKRVKWFATTLSRKPHDLLFFKDNLSVMKFFVDSDLMVNIIPLFAATIRVSDKLSADKLFKLNNAETKRLVNVRFPLKLA